MLIGLLFWAVVLYAIVRVVAYLTQQDELGHKRPEDILKERYARGEIDHDEFERRKRELSA
jgi:putative membrane protein